MDLKRAVLSRAFVFALATFLYLLEPPLTFAQSDPQIGKFGGLIGTITFFDGLTEGKQNLCLDVVALKPAPQDMPYPGSHSVRYTVYVSEDARPASNRKKALNLIALDGKSEFTDKPYGPSEYVGGGMKISPGKHTFTFGVTERSYVRVAFVMQSHPKTGEVVATVSQCKFR